ncbi:MAG: hypothetical protein A2942_03160 [Candidatus Lloydbacteria bacterium RIFCSPLOWO2_01_FULL_50_20]|uniref:Uncharacterized protein n=1 Tax=Candidatus Lloydbacteria bacterium RIFCSPLOWO2_01_FULL_50_20 TaxID=1798665 RepID=A0A1G2DF59_9BACT|nr:MAG: hypothetical protein A2942_03160 [Candidatus Lloydbacteria bacterium RIFCSPLOWO2_01_FULL_50_20]
MKVTRKDLLQVFGIVVVTFLAGIAADKVSGNYWIGYFTMMGALILGPNIVMLRKIFVSRRV